MAAQDGNHTSVDNGNDNKVLALQVSKVKTSDNPEESNTPASDMCKPPANSLQVPDQCMASDHLINLNTNTAKHLLTLNEKTCIAQAETSLTW